MLQSKVGRQLTESSEGLRLKSYLDTGGVWTIGYGHTNGVKPNQVITKEIADQLFEIDNDFAENCINKYALPCNQNQFDALVDFVFNVGPAQFLSSHLYRYHKSGEYDKAAAEFPKWKYDNGKVIPGLVTRRAAEQHLYNHQGPVVARPNTDAPTRSEPSVAGSASPRPGPDAVQSSPVPPVLASNTAPGSNNGQSEFLSQAWGLVRNLIGKGPKV